MPHSADARNSSTANVQSIGAFLRLQIDCETITGPDTQGGAPLTAVTPQEPEALFQGGADVFDGDVPSTQDILNLIASKYFQAVDPSNPDVLNGYLQYLKEKRKVRFVDSRPGSCSRGLTITVECSTLQILDELWQDNLTGHLNEMAQRFLVTDDILKSFGITEMRLITVILKNEYEACRMNFLKHPVTDSSAVWEDGDNGDLPEIQDLSIIARQNTARENFEELSSRRKELHDAFLQWIPIRARTKKKLDELATELHERHRNATKANITGASMGTVGGILALAGLITAPFTFGAGLIVSLVGAGIGGVGGLVMSGSKLTEFILEKSGLKEVQAAIEEDREACRDLQQQLDSLGNFISIQAEFLKHTFNDPVLLRKLEGNDFEFFREWKFFEDTGSSTKEKAESGARLLRAAPSAATISTSATAVAGRAALAGARAAHFAGSAIGVVLLPLDITLLVKSSLELHRGSTTEAVEKIRRILSELDCPNEEEIEGFLETFIKKKFFDLKCRHIDKHSV